MEARDKPSLLSARLAAEQQENVSVSGGRSGSGGGSGGGGGSGKQVGPSAASSTQASA